METHNSNDNDNQEPSRALTTRRREFGAMAINSEGAATAALVARAKADIESRFIMAMRCPRNLDDARQNMLKECRRDGFAQQAIYSIPISGKPVEGLTIRFAEVAARCFGNMPIETVTIYDSDSDRIVRVTVTDLESNVTWSRDITIKKTVERKQTKKGQRIHGERVNSYGDRVFIVDASDDEVNVKEASAVSKAARTGILRLIPGYIQDEMFDLCKKLAADKSAKDPDAARVKMLDAFAAISVMPSDLEQWLGHDTTKMAPAELESLRGLYVAISEGEITWVNALSAKLDGKPVAAPIAPPPASAPATRSAPTTQAGAPPTAPANRKRGGAAALKDQLKGDKPAEPAPTPEPPKEPTSFDKAAADARAKDAERAAESGGTGGGAPTETVDDSEDDTTETCASCGVPIDPAPKGSECYACRQS